MPNPPATIPSFHFWCQKILPLVYDDSLSYYEVLCKVRDVLNTVIGNVNNLNEICSQYGLTIEQILKDVADLQSEIEKVKNGDYVSLYLDSIINWIDENLQCLVARIVKYVCFGLSTDGHFVAYIPPAWDFLTFDTIIQPDNPLYGHLVLKW